MRFYGPKEVCAKLNIGDSTLRKWAGYLIKLGGYQFVVDQYGHRSYSDRDIVVLQSMQELLSRKYTYEDAVKEICSVENANHAENAEKLDEESVLPITHVPSVLSVPSDEVYREVINAFQKQTEINQRLVEHLERLEERIQRRDEERDEKILEALRLMQEIHSLQEQAATLESQQVNEGPKRRPWWRFGR